MKSMFIPQPKKIRTSAGSYTLPIRPVIYLPARELMQAVSFLQSKLSAICTSSFLDADIQIELSFTKRGSDGYILELTPARIIIRASAPSGVFYACQTLLQLIECSASKSIPCCIIEDWPDFQVRGIYYDISRGRIPKIERLKEQIDILSRHKINQYQLYFEHVFRFKKYPEIWRGRGCLTAEDIHDLDEYCSERFVELVPSFASFGHMANILNQKRFRGLAEDLCRLEYQSPDADKLADWKKRKGASLAPANPGSYKLLEELFAEFLPAFSSNKFNICCDETFDLGLGQSYQLAQRKGRGRLYLDHILRLRELAGKYGKKIMFWGDIIHKYPELIQEIPKDVTVLDWGYDHNTDYKRVARFKKAGLRFYACPGTSSWVSLFPRIHEAEDNISGFAKEALKHGADGLMVTDWGDGGHYNFMEYSWPGYLYGAEQAWNTSSDRHDFAERFACMFIKTKDRRFAGAFRDLGAVAHISADAWYQSIWAHIFFAWPGDKVLSHCERTAWVFDKNAIRKRKIMFDERYAKLLMKKLLRIRAVFACVSKEKCTDPYGLLPFWIFAVDSMVHAVNKLALMDGLTERNCRALLKEVKSLKKRFLKLWNARNSPSEICIALGRYDRYISILRTKFLR